MNTKETFIQNVLAREYLLGNRDLKIPIIIPEVKMSIGGTLNLHTGELTGGE